MLEKIIIFFNCVKGLFLILEYIISLYNPGVEKILFTVVLYLYDYNLRPLVFLGIMNLYFFLSSLMNKNNIKKSNFMILSLANIVLSENFKINEVNGDLYYEIKQEEFSQDTLKKNIIYDSTSNYTEEKKIQIKYLIITLVILNIFVYKDTSTFVLLHLFLDKNDDKSDDADDDDSIPKSH